MFVFLIGTGLCGSPLVHEPLARQHAVGFVSNLGGRLPRRLPTALVQPPCPRPPSIALLDPPLADRLRRWGYS